MMTYFLISVGTIVLAYCIHSGFKYTRMISNIFLSIVYKPELETTPTSRGEKVTILDSSDKEIEALLIESKNADKIVVFCHESGSGKDSWEKYASFLPAQGAHIVSFDFRSAPSENPESNSLTQWPTEEDVTRLVTVIRWAKKALGKNLSVFLFGVSNGADIAFAASFREASVKGVIADGLFSMKEVFRDYIRKWGPILVKPNLFGENYPFWVVNLFANLGFWYSQKKSKRGFVDVEKLLSQKHVPLLMIHGEKDDYIPLTHQKYLEKKNKASLHRLVVPSAGHNEAISIDRSAYQKEITQFLGKNS